MFESLRLHRGATAPGDAPEQPGERRRRPWLLPAYLTGGAAVCLAWLVTRLLSEDAAADFGSHVVQPYVLMGVLVFFGRAMVRDRLRWCRSCNRWRAMEWKGERVLHRRPIMQQRKTFTETYNARGERVGSSRQHSTSRGVRETVAVDQVCRYCGARRSIRETRDK
jgi:hypothetical protein